jgi:hypothetical protein
LRSRARVLLHHARRQARRRGLRPRQALAVYAEEGLARREVAVWLGDEEMAFEYAGRTLSRYDVSLSRDAAKLEAITNPRLFATPYQRSRPELRLFDL